MPSVRKPARRSPNLIDRRGENSAAARARNQQAVASGRSGGPGTVPASYYAQDALKVPLIGRSTIGRATAGLAKAPANPNRTRVASTTGNSAVRPRPAKPSHPLTNEFARMGRGRGSRSR